MSNNCEHCTSQVLGEFTNRHGVAYSISICNWECGELLVSLTDEKRYTYTWLLDSREEIEALRTLLYEYDHATINVIVGTDGRDAELSRLQAAWEEEHLRAIESSMKYEGLVTAVRNGDPQAIEDYIAQNREAS